MNDVPWYRLPSEIALSATNLPTGEVGHSLGRTKGYSAKSEST